MKKIFLGLVVSGGMLLLGLNTQAQAKTFRAREMTSEQWSQLTSSGSQEAVVEFRQGDDIPVSFSSEGDLLETTQVGISYVRVKRSFWLRLHLNNVEISLDGVDFKSLKDVLTGSLEANAGASAPGVPVNAINVMLKAYLK